MYQFAQDANSILVQQPTEPDKYGTPDLPTVMDNSLRSS